MFTSGWKLAVNLRVDFFVSNVASYFLYRFSYDGDDQHKTLRREKEPHVKSRGD